MTIATLLLLLAISIYTATRPTLTATCAADELEALAKALEDGTLDHPFIAQRLRARAKDLKGAKP